MAWRPNEELIEGELENTTPGRVTGWMRFVGLPERVTFQLRGDFHRDIRGTRIRLKNPEPRETRQGYMTGFALRQEGEAGDITAGLPPQDYVNYPYIEWYSDNGRVVLELSPEQVEVIGMPLPWEEQEPLSREEQNGHLAEFVKGVAASVRQDLQADGEAAEGGKFSLGRVVITRGALGALRPEDVLRALLRHRAGDWGEVCKEDRQENELSLKEGCRLLSAYRSGSVRFWIITEADRSATTVLLPEEY